MKAITKIDYDIIISTECWLKIADPLPSLNGYTAYSTSNNQLKNDGVPKSDLDDVADLTDRVNDIAPSTAHVVSVTSSAHTSALEDKLAELTRQVEILSTQVKKTSIFRNKKAAAQIQI
ncbi:unnamed protein product [Euphydryas editha]|uniref:Uncharacterized protein n=1 Tax=Euphydryas editha TaxID=104508 RepID=A0AAU9V9T8_EUPED|nr:unnamed protein product [Euphydryas editha]